VRELHRHPQGRLRLLQRVRVGGGLRVGGDFWSLLDFELTSHLIYRRLRRREAQGSLDFGGPVRVAYHRALDDRG
jgi:hypothetical protein